MRILKNRCPCKVWPAHETTYHEGIKYIQSGGLDARVVTSQPEPSIVLWLRSLFFFGLRWCAALVTGRASMRPAYAWIHSRLRSSSSSEHQQLMEPGLRSDDSADVSKPSNEDLEKIREWAMQHVKMQDFELGKSKNPATLYYPPKEEDDET